LIESEHVLLALLRRNVLLLGTVAVETLRKSLEARVGPGKARPALEDIHFSNETKRILAYAAEESEVLGQRQIDAFHLALGVLHEKNSRASLSLGEQGITRETLVNSRAG